jgi:hypothetical protein
VLTVARREARVDQHERAAVAVAGGDQFRRAMEQALDVVLVAPAERHGLRPVHQLPDVVVLDVRRLRPERKHVARRDLGIHVAQRRFPGGAGELQVAVIPHGSKSLTSRCADTAKSSEDCQPDLTNLDLVARVTSESPASAALIIA